MQRSAGTEALIALEDAAPDLLFDTFPGSNIRAWPLLRWQVALSLAEAELNKYGIPFALSPMGLILRGTRASLPNRHASSHMRAQSDALFMVDGGTYAQSELGRKNWLIEDHATAIADRAVVLQSLPVDAFTPGRERPTFQNTYSFDDAILRVEIAARVAPPGRVQRAFINSFVREVYAGLDFHVEPARIAVAERQLVDRFARAPHAVKYLSRVLDHVQPKVAFTQTGAYGDRSHLISLLKDRGVYVAEPQHGWIGPSHGAYNFGAAMRSPEMMRTLPDTLLTFGDFWSDAVRFPGQKVSIGKPHLEQAVAGLKESAEQRAAVLVVSSASHRDDMTRFTRTLRDSLPADWRILFRPHPSERATVASLYPGLANEDKITFDLAPDVYTSLARVRGVFGLASTVLYEALAFGCAVYVMESPLKDLYIEKSLFEEPITDDTGITRAVEHLVSGEKQDLGLSASQLSRVWKPNSVVNFTKFYAGRG